MRRRNLQMRVCLSVFLAGVLGLLLSLAQEATEQPHTRPIPQYLVVTVAYPHEERQARQIVDVSEQGADEVSIRAAATQHGFTVVKKGYILYAFSPGVVYSNPAVLRGEVIECLLQEQRTDLCEVLLREWFLYELWQSKESLGRQEDTCGAIETWVSDNTPKFKAYVQFTLQMEELDRDLRGLLYETTLTNDQMKALSQRLQSVDPPKQARSKELVLRQLSMRKPVPEVTVQYNSLVPPEGYSVLGQGAFEALTDLHNAAKKRLEQMIDTFTSVLGASYGITSGMQPYESLPDLFRTALRENYEAPITRQLLQEIGANSLPLEALSRARVAIRFLPTVSFSVVCGDHKLDVDVIIPEGQIRITQH